MLLITVVGVTGNGSDFVDRFYAKNLTMMSLGRILHYVSDRVVDAHDPDSATFVVHRINADMVTRDMFCIDENMPKEDV